MCSQPAEYRWWVARNFRIGAWPPVAPKHDHKIHKSQDDARSSKWCQHVLSITKLLYSQNGSKRIQQSMRTTFKLKVLNSNTHLMCRRKSWRRNSPIAICSHFIQRIPTAYSPGITSSRIDRDGSGGQNEKKGKVYAALWICFFLISVKHATLLPPACNPPSRKGLISGDL